MLYARGDDGSKRSGEEEKLHLRPGCFAGPFGGSALSSYNVAIVGATGLVGQELVRILQERKFPLSSIHLLASDRSAGKKVYFDSQEVVVEETTPQAFNHMDVAFFSAGAEASQHFAPLAAKAGVMVIDNSAA